MRCDRWFRRAAILSACAGLAVTLGACSSADDPDGTTARHDPTPVPMSASVTVAPGAHPRTDPGTTLDFGETATLPAQAFTAGGALAQFTVTGITPARDVPDTVTHGGEPYFVYVTVTSLASHASPGPGVVGLAGSADGRAPALTISPTVGVPGCTATTPPATMRRGESYATCLLAIAETGQDLPQVIYWADTTGDDALDYQRAPVVWRAPTPPAPPTS